MEKILTISIIVGIIIVVGVIGFQLNETMWQRTTTQDYYEEDCGVGCEVKHVVYPDNPQMLYGLKINKDRYLLGENVYVTITEIPMELKTRVLFYTPSGVQFYEINIDGERNSGFKQYFKPQLLKNRNLCDVNDLIGQWTVMFENNPYERLNFEMTGEYLPEQEKHYDPITCGQSIQLPLNPGYIPPED